MSGAKITDKLIERKVGDAFETLEGADISAGRSLELCRCIVSLTGLSADDESLDKADSLKELGVQVTEKLLKLLGDSEFEQLEKILSDLEQFVEVQVDNNPLLEAIHKHHQDVQLYLAEKTVDDVFDILLHPNYFDESLKLAETVSIAVGFKKTDAFEETAEDLDSLKVFVRSWAQKLVYQGKLEELGQVLENLDNLVPEETELRLDDVQLQSAVLGIASSAKFATMSGSFTRRLQEALDTEAGVYSEWLNVHEAISIEEYPILDQELYNLGNQLATFTREVTDEPALVRLYGRKLAERLIDTWEEYQERCPHPAKPIEQANHVGETVYCREGQSLLRGKIQEVRPNGYIVFEQRTLEKKAAGSVEWERIQGQDLSTGSFRNQYFLEEADVPPYWKVENPTPWTFRDPT